MFHQNSTANSTTKLYEVLDGGGPYKSVFWFIMPFWLAKTGIIGRREKTPTPKTRFSIWTLRRTPGRFTTRPLPVYFTTKMSVVRPFSVLSKDEIGP